MSENLWLALKKSSDRAAIFIIRRDTKYRTQQNVLVLLTYIIYTLSDIVLITNIVQHKEGIVIAAINTIFILMSLLIIQVIFELIREKDRIHEVISWCTEPTWKKFHSSIQPYAGNRFIRIRHISTQVILFQIKLYDFLAIGGSLGVATVMQCVPSLRYQLPIPWHLPIEDYKNWKAFLPSLTLQITCSVFMAQVIGLFASLMIVFYLHVKEFLDIILDGLDRLKQQLTDAEVRKGVDVDRSLRDFTKMISSCVRIMSVFTKTMSNVVMYFEILSFASIFTNAFIILIVRQKEHYFLACNVLVLNVVTLGIAYINDMLKEKLFKVSYALYELPWDELTPKQRNFIRITMQCINVNVDFNCGSMHELNVERFGNVTKQAYSNALVLKKVLEKSMVGGFEKSLIK